VQGEMLPVGDRCGALKVMTGVEPQLTGLTDGRRLARRDVNPLTDIDRNLGLAGVGVLLSLEGFDMPGAVDAVVIYPRSRYSRSSSFRRRSPGCLILSEDIRGF
jgi:hypothetical protein